MKKLRPFLITFIFWIVFLGFCHASPYLICDPYPNTALQPTTFSVIFDDSLEVISTAKTKNQVPASVAARMGANDVILCLDFATVSLTRGSHTVYAVAKNGTITSVKSSVLIFNNRLPRKPIGDVQ